MRVGKDSQLFWANENENVPISGLLKGLGGNEII